VPAAKEEGVTKAEACEAKPRARHTKDLAAAAMFDLYNYCEVWSGGGGGGGGRAAEATGGKEAQARKAPWLSLLFIRNLD
jgi:hypothetical protein